MNVNRYVGNGPTNGTDPEGLQQRKVIDRPVAEALNPFEERERGAATPRNPDGSPKEPGQQFEEIDDAQRKIGRDRIRSTEKSKGRDRRELRDWAEEYLESIREKGPLLMIDVGVGIVIGTIAEDVATGGGGILDDPVTIGPGAALIWKGITGN